MKQVELDKLKNLIKKDILSRSTKIKINKLIQTYEKQKQKKQNLRKKVN